MASNSRDVRIRLESVWEGAGFDVATRSVSKFETDYRRMAMMQTRAESEMADAMAKRAAAAEQANSRQMTAMDQTGRVLLGVAGASAAGLALATREAINWESAWAGVRKTTDGSPEQMAALQEELRGLARTLPATHDEIAAVAEAAGQLGVKREDISDFTRVMVDLGETTDLSADQAATSLAQLMNIMGTAPDDVSRLGSTLVALGNDGASTESQIVLMAQRIAGAGKLVGATEGEVLAAASALSSMGVSAELGGGVVSRVMQDIYSAVQTGGPQLEGFAKVAGMSAQEFTQAWQDDPVRALAGFADGLNGVEASGGNVITTLTDLGIRSSEEQRVILQLKANADLLTGSLDLQSQAWAANSALTDEANQRYQTTEARLQVARNQINDAAIDIGGNFLPAVAGAAEWVGQLATGFGALPQPVQTFTTQLGAAATGLGLVLGGAAVVVPKLAELSTTMKNLRGGSSLMGSALGGAARILSGPFGIALAGAGVALAIMAQRQGEAKQRVEELRSSLDEQTASVTANTREMVAADLAVARGGLSQLWDPSARVAAADAAKNLGIELETLTDAAMGNVTAMQQVQDAISAIQSAEGYDNSQATSEQRQAIDAVTEAVARNSGSIEDAIVLQEQINALTGEDGVAAMDANAAATTAAAEAQSFFGDEADAAATEAAELNEQIDAMIQLLSDLNDPVLNVRESQRAWQEQLDAVTASIETNGTSLDISTEKGRANQEVLDGLAGSAMDLAAAIYEETGSEEAFRESLGASRQSLYETARRFGLSEDAAWDYVDSVLSIPEAPVTVPVLDTRVAESNLQRWINRTTGKRITVYVDTYAGNTYDYDANNSFNMLARSGGGRITGPGTTTSDSIPVRASNNEHMWSAAQTQAAGGHDVMDRIRADAEAGIWDPIRGYGLPTGAGSSVGAAAPVTSGASAGTPGGGAGGRSYDIDINMAMPPGYAEVVADATAQRIKTRLGDALAAAGVIGSEVL